MQDFVQDPDPVRRHVLQTVDELAIILGLTTANDRALHPAREPSDVPGADAGDVERALRRMREG
jgi:nicotinamide mononucleotide adenylyltransferase